MDLNFCSNFWYSCYGIWKCRKNTLSGLIFGLASALGFSIFSVTLRWKKNTPKFTTVALSGLFCCVFSIILILINDLNFLSTNKNQALFATHGTLVCIGLIMYSIGSKNIPATDLTLLSLTEVQEEFSGMASMAGH